MAPRKKGLHYPVAIKTKAESLYLSGLSITSVHHTIKAMPDCERLTRKTIVNWHRDGKWMERRANFIELARAKTEADALVQVGRHVDLLEEVLDKLREKLRDKALKAGSIEGVSYAIRTISKAILDITNPKTEESRPVTAKRTGEKRVVTFEGSYREEIQSAQEEVSIHHEAQACERTLPATEEKQKRALE